MAEPWNIDAGELYQRVTVQQLTNGADDSRGHPARSWANRLTDIAAKVETPTGRRMEIARQYVPTATHVITIRGPRSVPIKTSRFVYKGRVFNIGWMNDVQERHVRLEFICTEEIAS